jgi:hypothetical protein
LTCAVVAEPARSRACSAGRAAASTDDIGIAGAAEQVTVP